MGSSEAARELQAMGLEERHRRREAIKRILRALRLADYANAGRRGSWHLEHLADRLEAENTTQMATGA